jgi:hypothetical protein
MYSLRVVGRMGMMTCSHRKGKVKDRNAYTAYPSTVLDCDTNIIFFYSSMASNTLIMHCNGRNLNTQYIDLSYISQQVPKN